MSKRKWCFSAFVIFAYLGGMFLLYKNQQLKKETSLFSTKTVEKISSGARKTEKKDEAIGTLIIPKINLVQPLYAIHNKKNNVEEHVMILKESTYPNEEKSKLFLAAHSGTGNIAFFAHLDTLVLGDKFFIDYKNKTYTYQINKIETQEKTGKITVPIQDGKQAVLTTCHPTQEKKQLVLSALLQKETDSVN